MMYPITLCDQPVGIVNNNPGNIWNDPGIQFAGEITAPGAQWKKFQSMGWGYRALMKNLQAYITMGLDTIPKITNTWAPAGHGNNNPVKYATDLSMLSGIPTGKVLSASDIDSLKKLSYGISYIEQGVKPSIHDIEVGANLLDASAPGGTNDNVTSGTMTQYSHSFNRTAAYIGIAAVIAYGLYNHYKGDR